MDDAIEKAVKDIMENHHKIINDWCKAYMAQIYQETGSIKPGDFILNEQVAMFHKGENCMAKKYWFELKGIDFMEPTKPDYYKAKGMECFDIIEAYELGFNLGNVVKYTLRAGKKEDKVKDLQKAIVYLQREIELSQKGEV
jgi:hypothetical protein